MFYNMKITKFTGTERRPQTKKFSTVDLIIRQNVPDKIKIAHIIYILFSWLDSHDEPRPPPYRGF